MREVEAKTSASGKYAPKLPRREASETGRLGREIYERDIRHRVEPEHVGKTCAIDVDSGFWALGESAREAAGLLRERRPEVIHVWLERVGYLALRSFGAGSLRRTE